MPLFSQSDSDKSQAFSDADVSNLKWFWRDYMRQRVWRLIAVMLLVISQGFVYQQFLSLTDQSLRIIFDSGSLTDLLWLCAMVFGIFMYRGIISFVVPRLSALLASSAVQQLRQDLISHIMILDLAYFERTSPGDFILRLVTQADALAGFVGQTSMRALRDVSTIIVVSAYLCYKQPLLFGIAALSIPVLVLAMQSVSHRIKDVMRKSENAFGAYINGIDEVVSAMRTVKMSDQVEVEKARLFESTAAIRKLTVRLQTAQATAQPFVDFAAAVVYMLVIGGGGYVVLSPDYDVDGATIITFMLGLVLIFDPARRVALFYAQVQAMLIILGSLRGLLDVTPTIVDAPDATDNFDTGADLKLDNVHFSYGPDQPLFEGLNMVFEGGKTTAIVGSTGSGKTSILSLLGRLYDPIQGQVLVGDTPIQDIQQSVLRRNFSVVSQDIVIFNASVEDNIRYVRPNATDAELQQAAEAAEIAHLMEQRGDVPVGPKGAQLSGGQRQRIGIARAFLRDAPIVFLDEATSALDQKTEERVKRALTRLSTGRTTIMVAHRLSTVVNADHIFVLEEGRVIENGTHSELMQAQGLYFTLFETQQRNYQTKSDKTESSE